MNIDLKNKVVSQYKSTFNEAPELIVYSPGRINLIGEHVDYNEGFVMPAAIDKAIYIAMGRSPKSFELLASDRNENIVLDELPSSSIAHNWTNYVLGSLNEIKQKGKELSPIRAVFSSDIPIGSGLSSSAALSCGFAFGVNVLFNLGFNSKEIAIIGQQAEHKFAGVLCGIMDQFASVHGKKDHFIILDCRDLSYSYSEMQMEDYSLVLFNSNVKHNLADSAYNKRKMQGLKVVDFLRKLYPEVKSLRDVNIDQLNEIKANIDEDDYIKARFIIEEIMRVSAVAKAQNSNDIEVIGELMNRTHQGLSEEYEVSCEELDFIQQEALQLGSIGSRMMGGGFGGCTINILKKGEEDLIFEELSKRYHDKFDKSLGYYKVNISNGTQII